MATLSTLCKMSLKTFIKLGHCWTSRQHRLIISSCFSTLSKQNQFLTRSSCCYFIESSKRSYYQTFCPVSLLSVTHGRKRTVKNTTLFSSLISNTIFIRDPVVYSQQQGLSSYPPEGHKHVHVRKSHGLTNEKQAENPISEEKLTLYQRFKKTYKEHGKVLIAVHLVTSTVWFGSFYTAARCGIDIVPYLESWNFSEGIIKPFRSGGLGDVALAYLLYKLASPARYTVTIGGTNLAIRYLRKEGKMPPVPKEDSLRSLYKEGKENLKRRSGARIHRLRRQNKNKHRNHSQEEKS